MKMSNFLVDDMTDIMSRLAVHDWMVRVDPVLELNWHIIAL